MLGRRKKLDQVSLEELERMLRIKRREARQARFIRLSGAGASASTALLQEDEDQTSARSTSFDHQMATTPGQNAMSILAASGPQLAAVSTPPSTPTNKSREILLLTVEIGAVLGLIFIFITAYWNLQTLNAEVAEVQDTNRLNQVISERLLPLEAAQVANNGFSIDRLPGGHTPPTAPGGAVPEVPAHLQNWVQPPPPIPIAPSTQQTAPATRLVIPKINVDAPIIAGVTWEDLKKGVGHLPGSAQPGERGNLYLAAHNDIFGEIFRYLDELEPGDEYDIYAGETKYTYVVREKRIIEPTEVSVMLPTTEPVATLQTCYPYLIDTHRLVVISDLVN